MNRARRGQDLFVDKADYQQFIDLLQEITELFNVNVAAYCLMPTHYHLMLQTPNANLSRCMRHLNGVYTQRYNVSHRCDGTLFRGRYKSILVDADNYVLQLVRYIHRNPLAAGLVKRLDQYVWSSHKGYLSKAKKWNWLYKHFVLDMLTTQINSQIQVYTIISEVGRYYKVRPTKLRAVRRGMENEPRDVAMYLIRSMRAEPLMRVGANFGLNQYSSVSSAVVRVKVKLQKDRKFKERVQHIESNILKGQT